jgi:hypothetical protein
MGYSSGSVNVKTQRAAIVPQRDALHHHVIRAEGQRPRAKSKRGFSIAAARARAGYQIRTPSAGAPAFTPLDPAFEAPPSA